MTRKHFTDLREWFEMVLAVLLISAVLTAMMGNYQRVSWAAYGVFCLMGLCFAVIYRITMLLILPRLLTDSAPMIRRFAFNISGILLSALLGGEVATRVLFHLAFESSGEIGQLRLPVVSIGLGVLVSIRLIELGKERLREKIRSGELREERVRRQALHAELTALQARTDPHFLFNSLNTIAGLIEEDPEKAVEVVNRVSGLFRHTVHGSRVERVRLEEEITAVSSFLEIQSLRFGNRLQWKVEVDPGLETTPIPPLILHPLVENAVLHGTSNRHPVTVSIRAESDGQGLWLTVQDDGPGPGQSKHQGSGTSLADLEERMTLLFGSLASLETNEVPGGGFRARLRIPLPLLPKEGQ